MSEIGKGDKVRVAKILNDPFGQFTEKVVGKQGVVVSKPDHWGYAHADIPGEGVLSFRVAELERVA